MNGLEAASKKKHKTAHNTLLESVCRITWQTSFVEGKMSGYKDKAQKTVLWRPIGHTIISKEFSTQISQFKSNTLSRKHIPNTKSVTMQPLTRPFNHWQSRTFYSRWILSALMQKPKECSKHGLNSKTPKSFRYQYLINLYRKSSDWTTRNFCTGNILCDIVVHHKSFVTRAIPSWIISPATYHRAHAYDKISQSPLHS